MKTIGIELNHVLRNINRQLLKYYAKAFDPSMDWEEMDDRKDVFEEYLTFVDNHAKNNFIYIDYPYEIFGCAKLIEKNLNVKLTEWLHDISNIEEEDIKVVLFSQDEGDLAIQSTFFFLSKIGCRVREMFFPESVDEVWEKCDVVISADKRFFTEDKPEGKKSVLIKREFNESGSEYADLVYDDLKEVFEDKDFFSKVDVIENKENENE